jgi:hypothetical protein
LEWVVVAIVLLGELFDFGDGFFDAAKGAASDGLAGDETEPALDLIERRAA